MTKPSSTGRKIAITATAILYSGHLTLADEFPLLTQNCELALALSAAPGNISKSATVYVLTEDGYEFAREGQNDFSCIVARNHPNSLLPICYDSEGSETILQTVIGTAELVLNGATDTEIDAAIVTGFDSGKYKHPKTSSLSYMLSEFNYGYREESRTMTNMRPHSMISTEHTRESINFDRELYEYHNVLPTISPMGPFRFFIIRAEKPTNSDKIATNCDGQLDFLPQ